MTNDADTVPTILLVDDNHANLLAVESVLEPLGYRIVTATSGAEALTKLIDHDFVLILMDVHMPGLDGYQTTALIRQHERSRDIPIVFLTALYDQPEHTYRGYALGAVDYIPKPFDPEVLRGKVRALIALYTRGQRAERERNEEKERMKDLFLGVVGHDLRNPLNSILLGAQLLQRHDACGNKSHATHAQRIERAGRRMHRLIEDILDLTRGQLAGGIPVSLAPCNLADVCRAVLDECRTAHPGREIQLELTGHLLGHWDSDRLARVVSNLVGNAVDHSREGPVRVSVREDGEHVVLHVHNGGDPIDPKVLPTLFEPFRRGGDSSGANGGLGLGLYIVREIVRPHRGTLNVTSTAAEGTTFTVTLPKQPPA